MFSSVCAAIKLIIGKYTVIRRAVLCIAAAAPLLLCSCNISVEDLMTAPSLTADQSAILDVIQQSNIERISLKYPISGDWRSPIQFFDLNGDGQDEAIVFYSVTQEINARIALLAKTDEEWIISSEYQGDGTEVNSVQMLSGTDANILVEWGSVNPNNRQFGVYAYIEGELLIGFKEECSDILMGDFNDDGILEFYYVSAEKPGERFRLKYADDIGRGYSIISEIELSAEMAALLSLKTVKNPDGQQLIFIDESIEGNSYATEVFALKNRKLSPAAAGGEFDIFSLSVRQTELISRVFTNVSKTLMMVPSKVASRETISDETLWRYWYYVQNDSLGYYFATFVNAPLNMNVAIPDEWLETVTVAESEVEQRLFIFTDTGTGETIFEIKVLRIEDSQQTYEDEGFISIQRSVGAYRYLYRAGEACSARNEKYIAEHFYGIAN